MRIGGWKLGTELIKKHLSGLPGKEQKNNEKIGGDGGGGRFGKEQKQREMEKYLKVKIKEGRNSYNRH